MLRLRRLVLLQKLLKLRHLELLEFSHPLLHLLLLQRRTARLMRQLFQQSLRKVRRATEARTASPSLLPASIEVSGLVGSSAHKVAQAWREYARGPGVC